MEIEDREAEIELKQCQIELSANPYDMELRDRERTVAMAYSKVNKSLLSYLSQKSKAHWLRGGCQFSLIP